MIFFKELFLGVTQGSGYPLILLNFYREKAKKVGGVTTSIPNANPTCHKVSRQRYPKKYSKKSFAMAQSSVKFETETILKVIK